MKDMSTKIKEKELPKWYDGAKYTEGEAVNRFRAIQRWFVSDGKIVQQSSYWQDIDDEEN